MHTKVVNNAQDFRAIKYGGASNQVASSNPPYDPQITSNQGVSSNQPYNSQFIKETPRRGTTYILKSGFEFHALFRLQGSRMFSQHLAPVGQQVMPK